MCIFCVSQNYLSPGYVKKVEGEGMPVYNPEEYKVEYFG